jgi:hypothetical protein
MKSKPVVPLLLLFGTAAVFGYTGCSVVFYTIGAHGDSSKPDFDTIPSWNAANIERGKDIKLATISGEELKGEYLGLDMVAASQYAKSYNEVQERYQKDIPLPALGDSISFIILNSEEEHRAEFSGFENQYMWVRVMAISGIMREKIDMNKLEEIRDRSGNLIDVQKLINLSSGGKIPALYTEVTLRTDSDTTRIPTASVSRIEIPNSKSARWIGLALGACIDAAIIAAVATPNLLWGSSSWSKVK